jgi:hypothetical protein
VRGLVFVMMAVLERPPSSPPGGCDPPAAEIGH